MTSDNPRPCSHAEHAATRASLEAFMRGTSGFFYVWNGALHADCARGCKSTIAIPVDVEDEQ